MRKYTQITTVMLVAQLAFLRHCMADATPRHNDVIVTKQSHFDFGKLGPTDVLGAFHVFTITNPGTSPVLITRLQPSCGCTSAILSDGNKPIAAPYELKPNTTIGVRVSVNPAHISTGWIDKYVMIYTDSGTAPALKLEITGVIDPGFSVYPAVVDFGKVKAGGGPSTLVTVSLNPHLLALHSEPSLVSTNSMVSVRDISGASSINHSADTGVAASKNDIEIRTYLVRLSPKAPIGMISGMICLVPKGVHVPASRLTSAGDSVDAALPGPSIPLIGEVVGDISASPELIVLGTVAQKELAVQRVSITASRPTSLAGLIVRSPSKFIRFSVTALGEDPATRRPQVYLEVSLSPDAPVGSIDSEIDVTTRSGQRLVIPIAADVSSQAN